VAWALSYAHGRGVVHRDVKPDNILLERATGRAMVMDFGIARSLAASGLTQMGETVGTPHFMSPEQAAGDKLDGRSDLYSLGVVAYFAVTGRLPFDAESAQAIMVAHISQAAIPVARVRPDLPTALATAIDRCLAKSPDERFATGEALVEALEQVRSRRVEVPAAIRVWTVRADQFFRNGMILAIVVPQMLRFGAPMAQLIFSAIVFAVIVPALWAQIPLGMRELARQGLAFGDLKNGVKAIDAEREAVVAAQRADPRFGRRRRARWFMLLAGFVLSVGTFVVAFSGRREVSPGHFVVSTPALVALFLSVCLLMTCVVFAVATLASSGGLDRRLHSLWTGRIGQFLFGLGSWRLREEGPKSGQASARQGMLTLFESLESTSRRRLTGLKKTVGRLEAALEELDGREQRFLAAVAEAKAGTPTLPGTLADQQRVLLDDLDRARRAVADRRIALLGVLEGVRLALIRLRSGLGTPEGVEAELAAATRLLDTPSS
jgi:serine/threonine-protein kinase